MAVRHTNSITPCPKCEEMLAVAHKDLQIWFRNLVKPKFTQAHISCSFRNKEDQEDAFLDGKTKLHWPNSKHNKTPAEALDLFQLDYNGMACWPWAFFRDIAKASDETRAQIEWGGVWTKLGDANHYEIISKDHAQS